MSFKAIIKPRDLLKLKDKSLVFFVLAFALYALWGSPTPNKPDWVEVVIAGFLLLAVGFSAVVKNFYLRPSARSEVWRHIAQIFFLFGIAIPLIIGVIQGAEASLIVRDMIAFVFLCLPLFLYDFFKQNKQRQKIFLGLCLIIGLFFALRVLVPHFLLFRNTTELLYLANSPLVLMSALYLAGQAGCFIYQKVTLQTFIKAALYLALCSVPIMAMFVDLQRASFIALIISFICLSLIGVIKAPIKVIMPFLVILIAGALFYDYGANLVEGVSAKTAQVGLNMRAQELQAVWAQASMSVLHIFLGQGWGSSFASPAVGDLNVTYTHSLLSYMFFKMGLVGLFLCLVYLYFIFEKLVRLYSINPVKGNAMIWPFIIPIFLYASHKSFDYGVLLTLILVSSVMAKRQEV